MEKRIQISIINISVALFDLNIVLKSFYTCSILNSKALSLVKAKEVNACKYDDLQ